MRHPPSKRNDAGGLHFAIVNVPFGASKHNDINNCIMVKNPTETLQRSVWAGPNLEYRFNSSDDVIQGCKVAVVKTAAPNQLPHAFNRVKFRAVGREKMQAKMTCNFPAPRLM